MKKNICVTVVLGILFGIAYSLAENTKKDSDPTNIIIVESRAFKPRQSIPSIYTCDSSDISPPLSWRNVPIAAKSLTIICDDPDAPAGTWVHWVVYDLLPDVDSLRQDIPRTDTIIGRGVQGSNDFKRIGYNGPCPPPKGPHRYFFKVYALDILLNLSAKKTKQDVEKAMKGHILAKGELVGMYTRKK